MNVLSVGARHRLVVVGVLASLIVGAFAIRAAAAWAESAAPLATAPVSADSVEVALATERQRSAALADELDGLATQTSDLRTALATALQRVAGDADTADALRAKLAATEKRLKKLQASMATATATRAISIASQPRASGGESEHEDEDEDEEHGDD
jgi:septal ring factor EnvC (AmiA/AmiB activator)